MRSSALTKNYLLTLVPRKRSVDAHLGELQHLGLGLKWKPLGDRELRDPVNQLPGRQKLL